MLNITKGYRSPIESEMERIFSSPYPHLFEVIEAACNRQLSIIAPNNSSEKVKIIWTGDENLSRPVVRRSNYRNTGKFPSFKTGKTVEWESQYELNAMQILEASPQVISYRSQPALIEYEDDEGNLSKHYPDLLVTLINGLNLILEIKPDNSKDNVDLSSRTQVLSRELKREGLIYMVVFQSQLGGVILSNSKYLKRLGSHKVNPDMREVCRRILQSGAISIGALLKSIALAATEIQPNLRPLNIICALILNGYIYCNMKQEISLSTQVFLCDRSK